MKGRTENPVKPGESKSDPESKLDPVVDSSDEWDEDEASAKAKPPVAELSTRDKLKATRAAQDHEAILKKEISHLRTKNLALKEQTTLLTNEAQRLEKEIAPFEKAKKSVTSKEVTSPKSKIDSEILAIKQLKKDIEAELSKLKKTSSPDMSLSDALPQPDSGTAREPASVTPEKPKMSMLEEMAYNKAQKALKAAGKTKSDTPPPPPSESGAQKKPGSLKDDLAANVGRDNVLRSSAQKSTQNPDELHKEQVKLFESSIAKSEADLKRKKNEVNDLLARLEIAKASDPDYLEASTNQAGLLTSLSQVKEQLQGKLVVVKATVSDELSKIEAAKAAELEAAAKLASTPAIDAPPMDAPDAPPMDAPPMDASATVHATAQQSVPISGAPQPNMAAATVAEALKKQERRDAPIIEKLLVSELIGLVLQENEGPGDDDDFEADASDEIDYSDTQKALIKAIGGADKLSELQRDLSTALKDLASKNIKGEAVVSADHVAVLQSAMGVRRGVVVEKESVNLEALKGNNDNPKIKEVLLKIIKDNPALAVVGKQIKLKSDEGAEAAKEAKALAAEKAAKAAAVIATAEAKRLETEKAAAKAAADQIKLKEMGIKKAEVDPAKLAGERLVVREINQDVVSKKALVAELDGAALTSFLASIDSELNTEIGKLEEAAQAAKLSTAVAESEAAVKALDQHTQAIDSVLKQGKVAQTALKEAESDPIAKKQVAIGQESTARNSMTQVNVAHEVVIRKATAALEALKPFVGKTLGDVIVDAKIVQLNKLIADSGKEIAKCKPLTADLDVAKSDFISAEKAQEGAEIKAAKETEAVKLVEEEAARNAAEELPQQVATIQTEIGKVQQAEALRVEAAIKAAQEAEAAKLVEVKAAEESRADMPLPDPGPHIEIPRADGPMPIEAAPKAAEKSAAEEPLLEPVPPIEVAEADVPMPKAAQESAPLPEPVPPIGGVAEADVPMPKEAVTAALSVEQTTARRKDLLTNSGFDQCFLTDFTRISEELSKNNTPALKEVQALRDTLINCREDYIKGAINEEGFASKCEGSFKDAESKIKSETTGVMAFFRNAVQRISNYFKQEAKNEMQVPKDGNKEAKDTSCYLDNFNKMKGAIAKLKQENPATDEAKAEAQTSKGISPS